MSSGLPLASLATDINARIAAGDRDFKKAKEHHTAASIHVVEARDRCKAEKITWAVWVKDNLDVGLRRSYDFIDLGLGKKTWEEIYLGRHPDKPKSVPRGAQSEKPKTLEDMARDTLRTEWVDLFDSLTNDQREAELNRMKETYRG